MTRQRPAIGSGRGRKVSFEKPIPVPRTKIVHSPPTATSGSGIVGRGRTPQAPTVKQDRADVVATALGCTEHPSLDSARS